MLTITEYLKEILKKCEKDCNEETENVDELRICMGKLKNYNPRLKSDEPSIYSNTTVQQLYLLKYAYAYGFEYLSICNEFIEDFADKEEISVVSLGCGTMLDYWALVYMLDERNASRPIVKYHGIDAIKWKHSLEAKAIGKDEKTFKFSPETFEDFFERQDNEFNTHDVYFFPKSISEFSDNENGKSAMEMMLNNLSAIKKDTIYFCISLRKGDNGVAGGDVGKVQKIIDKLEEEKTGFCVKNVKCITDTQNTIDKLKEKGLRVENVELIPLGKKQVRKDKNIWDTDVAKKVLKYPPFSEKIDNSIIDYIGNLKTKCVHKSLEKDKLCRECVHYPCELHTARTMIKTKYICDLIIKFERR